MSKKNTMTPKECLFPRVTATMNLKWDVNKTGKVFVWAGDTAITLLGFSNVAQILKYEYICGGDKSMVRKTTHFANHCVHDSLMTYVICMFLLWSRVKSTNDVVGLSRGVLRNIKFNICMSRWRPSNCLATPALFRIPLF